MVVDARSVKIDRDEAWNLLKDARSIVTAKGEAVQSWHPQSDAKEEILRHVIGPSGNLRAPTLRAGNDFLVGFNTERYANWLSRK